MIIDGKNESGKRISVSVDETLYSLFDIQCDINKLDTRSVIRELMAKGVITNSASARTYMLLQIAKPSLTKRHLKLEPQIDIEELV